MEETVPPLHPHGSTPELVSAARRRGGLAAAVVAGAMLGVRDVLEPPKEDEIAVVVDAPGEPDDLDTDGLTMTIAGVTVGASARPRKAEPPTTPGR